MQSPVSVMQTAGEGGAWGIAVLARYLIAENDVNLSSYLNEIAFKDTESIKIEPNEKRKALIVILNVLKRSSYRTSC